jgi:hypothetical protein
VITIFLLLGGILVIGLALAAELLRVSGAGGRPVDPARWRRELTDAVGYRPMSRVFAAADFLFLTGWGADRAMRRRLRRSRAEVMTLYLRQLRGDFQRVWALCRLLAPFSHDSNLSILLVRQFVLFHCLYFLLRLRCLTGWYGSAEGDIAILFRVLSQIRSKARKALQSSQISLEPAGC